MTISITNPVRKDVFIIETHKPEKQPPFAPSLIAKQHMVAKNGTANDARIYPTTPPAITEIGINANGNMAKNHP